MFKSHEFIREIEPAFETLGETQTEIPMALDESAAGGGGGSDPERVQDRYLQAKGDGMEEQKEEVLDSDPNNPNPGVDPNHALSLNEPQMPANVTDENGFRSQVESFLAGMFGGCGEWMLFQNGHHPGGARAAGPMHPASAARYYHPQHPYNSGGAGYPPGAAPPNAHLYQLHPHGTTPEPAPLSIAEELQRLAMQNPQFQPNWGPPQRGRDIPRFLGEHGEHDDDQISAISAHTLEEMARRQAKQQQQQAALQQQQQLGNANDAGDVSLSDDGEEKKSTEPSSLTMTKPGTRVETIDETTSFHGPEVEPEQQQQKHGATSPETVPIGTATVPSAEQLTIQDDNDEENVSSLSFSDPAIGNNDQAQTNNETRIQQPHPSNNSSSALD